MPSVLIAVFDGLQPAQVTSKLMPNLTALAAKGVTFNNHHPVFPTVTRTNACSMVTGHSPGGHGLAANTLSSSRLRATPGHSCTGTPTGSNDEERGPRAPRTHPR